MENAKELTLSCSKKQTLLQQKPMPWCRGNKKQLRDTAASKKAMWQPKTMMRQQKTTTWCCGNQKQLCQRHGIKKQCHGNQKNNATQRWQETATLTLLQQETMPLQQTPTPRCRGSKKQLCNTAASRKNDVATKNNDATTENNDMMLRQPKTTVSMPQHQETMPQQQKTTTQCSGD